MGTPPGLLLSVGCGLRFAIVDGQGNRTGWPCVRRVLRGATRLLCQPPPQFQQLTVTLMTAPGRASRARFIGSVRVESVGATPALANSPAS